MVCGGLGGVAEGAGGAEGADALGAQESRQGCGVAGSGQVLADVGGGPVDHPAVLLMGRAGGAGEGFVVAAVSVDEDDGGEVVGAADEFGEQVFQGGLADGQGAGEARVFATRAVRALRRGRRGTCTTSSDRWSRGNAGSSATGSWAISVRIRCPRSSSTTGLWVKFLVAVDVRDQNWYAGYYAAAQGFDVDVCRMSTFQGRKFG